MKSIIDRLPPHSIEAEQGVLGCILLDPTGSTGRCIEKIQRGHLAFYELRHQLLYKLLVEMFDDSKPVDLVTLSAILKDRNELEKVGGISYLSELMDSVPSAANLDYYLEILLAKMTRRSMLAAASKITSLVFDEDDDLGAFVDGCEKEIMAVTSDRENDGISDMKTHVVAAVDMLEQYHKNQGKISGIETGFCDLDRMTHGLNPGEMIVLAARPSMGKTSLAMNIAEHVAIENETPVGIFSLEMTAESLAMRMLCGRSRINLRNVRDGIFEKHDFPRITRSSAALAKAPIIIDDTGGLSILQLRARARRMAQQHDIKLLVIDYLQLLTGTSRKSENRQQEIAEISNGVKALAKELRLPVIVLSQLNRDMEKDKARKPRMSDLRESGAIEQDADVVGLLYRPEPGTEIEAANPELMDVFPVHLLIAKQRNGPTGDIKLTFLKPFTRFENCAKIAPEDVPK